MSIIYEALKKVETSRKGEHFNSYKRKVILSSFIAVVVFLILFFIFQDNFINSSLITNFSNNKFKPAVNLNNQTYSFHKTDNRKNPKKKYFLQGILYTEDNPVALINGKKVFKGEEIDGAQVTDITGNGVELKTKKGNIYLEFTD